MTALDMYSYSLWLTENFYLRLFNCYFRWDCSFIAGSPHLLLLHFHFLSSALSHRLSWHIQTETLLMPLKAFSCPLVLPEATKHRLSWPVITFSPLSDSPSSTYCSPPSPSLCYPQLTDILIFPRLYLSSPHLHLVCSQFHSKHLSRSRNLAHQLVCTPCSILSQTDWWSVQLCLCDVLLLCVCVCMYCLWKCF